MRYRNPLIFSFLVFISFTAGCLQDDFKTICGYWPDQANSRVTFCSTLPPDFDFHNEYPIIYFLHGATGNAFNWDRSPEGKEARQYAAQKYKQIPIVVALSFGPQGLITDTQSNHLKTLIDEFIPFVETTLPSNGKRGVWGHSMGGFNGFQLYFKKPEMFDSFTLGCPAVTPISNHSTEEEITDYVERTGAIRSWVNSMNQIFALFFPTRQDWDRHDILRMADELPPGAPMPPLAFSWNTTDQLGFQEGSEQLLETLALKNINPQYKIIEGSHCSSINVRDFVDFHQQYLF